MNAPRPNRPTPPRHRLSDVVAPALQATACAFLADLAADGVDPATFAAVREQLADDIEHIVEHADPTRPGARVRYGWVWDLGGTREREAARSLGVVVHVCHRDGREWFELGRWRVRELCTADGRPVDTLGSLRHLAAQMGAGPVPDDPRALAPRHDDPERVRLLRLTVAALTPTDAGHRACCVPGGPLDGMEVTDDHRHAHALAESCEPDRRAGYRAALLAELHRLTGRAA